MHQGAGDRQPLPLPARKPRAALAEAQVAVVETVKHLKGSLTILAVSHQDLLIEAADRIYRLAGGKIGLDPRLEDVAGLPVHG